MILGDMKKDSVIYPDMPLIVISGFARCGTSILHKILDDSGIHVVEAGRFARYGSENVMFTKRVHNVNCEIPATWLVGERMIGTDMLVKPKKMPANISSRVYKNLVDYENFIKKYNNQMVKDPLSAFAMPYFCKNLKTFDNAKFIGIFREPRAVAKSLVRLKVTKFPKYFRGKLTYKSSLAIAENHMNQWEKFLSDRDSVVLKHEDLVQNTDIIAKQLEDFLSIPIDTSAVDKTKVWGRT